MVRQPELPEDSNSHVLDLVSEIWLFSTFLLNNSFTSCLVPLQQPQNHWRRGQYCDMSASLPGTWTGTDTPGEIRPGKAMAELCEEGM